MSTPVLIACIVTAAVALFLAVAFIKPVKGLFLLVLNSAAGWAENQKIAPIQAATSTTEIVLTVLP